MRLDLDAIKKRHLDPEKNRGRTYYVGHIEVDLASVVEEAEWLRAEVEWLRTPVARHELCVTCGHKKLHHHDWRSDRSPHDLTRCFGQGLDCDNCAARCERFVRPTHDGDKP